jgi:hypothetical protein
MDADVHINIDERQLVEEFTKLRLTPNLARKKQRGEVFTPDTLINEMLDKLPNEVWSNEELKWFDPAVGIGNFMIQVYYRLMKGLEDKIPDESKRKEHIVSNMLYMSEIDDDNVSACRKIFGVGCNAYHGDTLLLDTEKTFGMDKFDVIVGNPPYNANGTLGTGNTIWTKFVHLALGSLNDDGYLVFVHPSGWRKPDSEKSKNSGLFELMTKSNHVLYLEMHSSRDGMKTFNAGTKYDWYILHTRNNDGNLKTVVRDEDGVIADVDLTKWSWLPNKKLLSVYELMGTGCKVLYSRSSYGADNKKRVSKEKTQEFKYPLIHSTPQSGVRYMYSNTKEFGMFGVSKVIFGDSGINDVVIDMKGKYGMTQHALAIEVSSKEEASEVSYALKTEAFQEILSACTWSNYQIDWRLFAFFKRDFYKRFLLE